MNDQIERPDFSKNFSAMAERIQHNKDSGFGGACVIVPPSGDPIEVLILDSSADLSQFFGTISSRLTIVINQLQDQTAMATTFGRGR